MHGKTQWFNYYFDPQFNNTEGCKYWSRVAREPIQLECPEKFSQNILIVEYFPYHSIKFKPTKNILPSQKYNGYLVEKAIKRNACVVIMRSVSKWLELVPELKHSKHSKYLTLNSSQRGYLSKGNMKRDDYDCFRNKLRSL